MPRCLLKINDLSDSEIRQVFENASRIGEIVRRKDFKEPLVSHLRVGLIFLQTSLRTRVGFEIAASLLGCRPVSVLSQRTSEASMPESVTDTVRIVGGMVDLVVGRFPVQAEIAVASSPSPVINGGDVGPCAEHPTQALVDFFAIEKAFGTANGLHIAVCGDLRFRATRSFLRLLRRYQPASVSLISNPALTDGQSEICDFRSRDLDLSRLDVLYVAGMPHQAIPEGDRDWLRVTADVMRRLPSRAIVISPLPIIDELSDDARKDPRCRFFEQSDDGLYVRAGVIQMVSSWSPGERQPP